MYQQSEKNVKQQHLLLTWTQYGNFGPLAAEIGSEVWGTPASVNGFRILSSLLQRRRSPEANQNLHSVWPSPGLVHYIHFRGLLSPDWILRGAKFTLRPSFSFSCIASITARHSSSGRQPNFVAWYTEWNYKTFTEGATYIRLGGSALAHILHRESKNGATLTMAITLSVLDRFAKFVHCCKQQSISNKIHIKLPTTP